MSCITKSNKNMFTSCKRKFHKNTITKLSILYFMVIEFNIISFSFDFFLTKITELQVVQHNHTHTNTEKRLEAHKKVSFISTLFDFPFHWVFTLNSCFSSLKSLAMCVSDSVSEINWEDFVATGNGIDILWSHIVWHSIQFLI